MLSANSKIIFISCIGKKKSIKDIALDWNYKYEAGKLYHGNSQEELVKNKFVKKDKSGKYVFYTANMNLFGKYIKEMIEDINDEYYLEKNLKSVLSENYDTFMEFLEEDFVMKKVFSLENIKKLYYNDRTLIPDNFNQCFFCVYTSLVIFFIVDGQKNKDRLLNIFNTLLLPETGCKINAREFIGENIRIFADNRKKMLDYKVLYDEYQKLL